MPPFERIVVLSGAGLSAASGLPTFRDADGLWEGHDVTEVATPTAWRRDPALVRRFYDERRVAAGNVVPNAGHHALVALQRAMGPDRCVLVTQNVDGLLGRAGAIHVVEMHGSLWRLRCEAADRHPILSVSGVQDPDARCTRCDRLLRPAIVWFGEVPNHLDRIAAAVAACDVFVSVGTSGVVYPAAGFGGHASRHGARTLEVNPVPSGAWWVDEVVPEPAEVALPRLVAGWTT